MQIIRVDSSYPNQNLSNEPVQLTSTGILLIRPKYDEGVGHVDSAEIVLSLAQSVADGSITVGVITQDWNAQTVTFNSRPSLKETKQINLSNASNISLDVLNELTQPNYGIYVWGSPFIVQSSSKQIRQVITKLLLPKKIQATKTELKWLPIRTYDIVRKVVLKRDNVIIFETEDINQTSFVDGGLTKSKNHTYELFLEIV